MCTSGKYCARVMPCGYGDDADSGERLYGSSLTWYARGALSVPEEGGEITVRVYGLI